MVPILAGLIYFGSFRICMIMDLNGDLDIFELSVDTYGCRVLVVSSNAADSRSTLPQYKVRDELRA